MKQSHAPLAIGTHYDHATVVEVVEYDPADDYQPYYYRLDTGEYVWIPITHGTSEAP